VSAGSRVHIQIIMSQLIVEYLQPTELGVQIRKEKKRNEYEGLHQCRAAPDCFCSTAEDPEHNIPAWTWPEKYGANKEKAFAELEEVLLAYEVGHDGIDGGGFEVEVDDEREGYIYVKFESLKSGYLDDLEVAYIEGMGDRAVQVRSSSRIGYLDYEVNAKRLNYISAKLRAKGWDAIGVDFKTHPKYVILNNEV
jgi:uncharacterized protein (DUF1499 family)